MSARRSLSVLVLLAALAAAATAAAVPRPAAPPPAPRPQPAAPPPAPGATPKPARPAPAPSKPAPKPRPKPAPPRAPAKRAPPLPAAVASYLQTLCASGQVAGDGWDYLQQFDLDGDGDNDVLIDQRQVRCAGQNAPHRPGTPFRMAILLSRPGGPVLSAYADVIDLQIDRSGSAPAVTVVLRGTDCGNVPPDQLCRSLLVWQTAARKFGVGPKIFIDENGRVLPGPRWPALAEDLPPGFAIGKLNMPKKAPPGGGCNIFYSDSQRDILMGAYRRSDWNELARRTIAMGCNSDLPWYFLGLSAERMGKFDAARIYYAKALERARKLSLNLFSTCAIDPLGNCWGINLIGETNGAMARLQTSPGGNP